MAALGKYMLCVFVSVCVCVYGGGDLCFPAPGLCKFWEKYIWQHRLCGSIGCGNAVQVSSRRGHYD